MKFEPLFLYAEKTVGTDILGNPITEMSLLEESEGFFSSWNNRELAADDITIRSGGRSVTVDNKKIITLCERSVLNSAEKVLFEGKYYNITTVQGGDYLRWRILIVDRYGSESP